MQMKLGRPLLPALGVVESLVKRLVTKYLFASDLKIALKAGEVAPS